MTSIVNALAIARAIGLEFRFVWPFTKEGGLSDHDQLFDANFISDYVIAGSDFEDRNVLFDPANVTLAEATEICRNSTGKAIIYVDEIFDSLAFADESQEDANARFQIAFSEICWNADVEKLIAATNEESFPKDYMALHVRAGDIVSGEWRQFLPEEKYLPSIFINLLIERQTNSQNNPIIVLSDNKQYADYLQSRYRNILLARDVFDGYDSLCEIRRAFADQMLFSKAKNIVGPRSAFCWFGARIGGVKIIGLSDCFSKDDAYSLIKLGILQLEQEAKKTPFLRSIFSRDICWFLDVYHDEMLGSERLELAQFAARLDPEYCGANNRLAMNLALAGIKKVPNKISARAVKSVKPIKRHQDPLCESLATSISVDALSSENGLSVFESILRQSLLHPLKEILKAVPGLSTFDKKLEWCAELAPFQIHWGETLHNLHYQKAIRDWLKNRDTSSFRINLLEPQNTVSRPLDLAYWRRSGFEDLQAPGSFPSVLRNSEVTSVCLACRLSAKLARLSSRVPKTIHLDEVKKSSSGLNWVHGWVFDPAGGRPPAAIGLFEDDSIISGSAIYIARPDVAEHFDSQNAHYCGFSIPVPLKYSAIENNLSARLRIF